MQMTRVITGIVALCGALSLFSPAPARADDVGFGIGYGRDRYGRDHFSISLNIRDRDRHCCRYCGDPYCDGRCRDRRVVVVRPVYRDRYYDRYDRHYDRDCDRRDYYRYDDRRYRDRYYDRDCDYRYRRY